jgi:plasmid stabilization system protein ParE
VVHRYYVVIFRLHEAAKLVEIVRVWDGRQDPAGLELP